MQPYFFPYLGYYSLIKHTDEFILFDTPQFIRHGWIERNRILNDKGEPFYFRVPLVKHSRNTNIRDIQIRNTENWKQKIISQTAAYKKRAPLYKQVIELLNECFEPEFESITKLNQHVLNTTSKYLNIDTPIKVWSEMNLKIDENSTADEWALNISKAIGADTYYNPVGGLEFFDKSKYINAGIDIQFMKLLSTKYRQFKNEFVPFLSVLDSLMFCSVDEVNNQIDNFEFV